jgi:hypothetical protein
MSAAAGTAYDFDGAQGLAGPHGLEPPRPRPEAGAHGLPAGPQGEVDGTMRPRLGAHGLSVPEVAGPQGLGAARPRPVAGPQGLPGPHGLRMACASWIGLSAAATGVGAGTVAATAAASVDRLPASMRDFIRLVCIMAPCQRV